MKRRWMGLLLALTLTASALPGASAAGSFSDVPETHWGYPYIEKARAAGLVQGYGDGSYGPDDIVHRHEFLTMVTRCFAPVWVEELTEQTVSGAPWWIPYLNAALANGYLEGTPLLEELNTPDSGGVYNEDIVAQTIDRYEMAQIMADVIEREELPRPDRTVLAAVPERIADWDTIPQRYREAVKLCYAAGMLTGNEYGQFLGQVPMNRAQAATVLCRLNDVLPGDAPAATVDGVDYSVGDLRYYYANVRTRQTYLSLLGQGEGFDPEVSEGAQWYDHAADLTWADRFRQLALEDLREAVALEKAARAEGYTLSEAGQQELEAQLAQIDQVCATYSISRDLALDQLWGHGVTEEVYLRNLERDILAQEFSDSRLAGRTYTDSQLLEYYKTHADELDSFDYLLFYIDGAQAQKKANQALEEIDKVRDKETAFRRAADKYGDEVYTPGGDLPDSFADDADAIWGPWLTAAGRKKYDVASLAADNGCYLVMFLDRYRNDDTTADVRHVLILADTTVAEDGTVSASASAMDAARTRAQAVLNRWKAGDKTEESFAQLAREFSADTGSAENGGLYTYLERGSTLTAFNDWCFDKSRRPGDTGLVENKGEGGYYGWHVMYYVKTQPATWKRVAAQDMAAADQAAWLEGLLSSAPAAPGPAYASVGAADRM